MTKQEAERLVMGYVIDNQQTLPIEVEDAIRNLVQRVNNYTVEDMIKIMHLSTYINLVDRTGHSLVYCQSCKIPKDMYNKFIRGIESESRSSIIIYLR